MRCNLYLEFLPDIFKLFQGVCPFVRVDEAAANQTFGDFVYVLNNVQSHQTLGDVTEKQVMLIQLIHSTLIKIIVHFYSYLEMIFLLPLYCSQKRAFL